MQNAVTSAGINLSWIMSGYRSLTLNLISNNKYSDTIGVNNKFKRKKNTIAYLGQGWNAHNYCFSEASFTSLDVVPVVAHANSSKLGSSHCIYIHVWISEPTNPFVLTVRREDYPKY